LNKLRRVLGWCWASPLTLCGLLYVVPFDILGWHRPIGTHGDAMVWQLVPERAPGWLTFAWRHGSGHAVGNVVVLNANLDTHQGRVVLKHEQDRVRQAMVLGAFYPLFYAVMWLGIRLACPRSSTHFSHPFELEARRAAGQTIDVEGTVEKLKKLAHRDDNVTK
jgi:hypothetical protein